MMGWTVEFILIVLYAWKHSLATQVIPLGAMDPPPKCFAACLWPQANSGLLRAVVVLLRAAFVCVTGVRKSHLTPKRCSFS